MPRGVSRYVVGYWPGLFAGSKTLTSELGPSDWTFHHLKAAVVGGDFGFFSRTLEFAKNNR